MWEVRHTWGMKIRGLWCQEGLLYSLRILQMKRWRSWWMRGRIWRRKGGLLLGVGLLYDQLPWFPLSDVDFDVKSVLYISIYRTHVEVGFESRARASMILLYGYHHD